jgi:hypothetical protein
MVMRCICQVPIGFAQVAGGFNVLGRTWSFWRKRLVVLFWLDAYFSPMGGDVLDKISKNMG